MLPEPDEIFGLLELSRSGNIRQLKVRLGEIKAQQADGVSRFVDRMLILCGDYRINAILQELEALIKSETPEQDLAKE